jgi:hypothetical protein
VGQFPVLKDLDKFVFADTPVDEGQVSSSPPALPTPSAIAIFIGGTGTGKTHLASASPGRHPRLRRGRFFNLVDLVNQLAVEGCWPQWSSGREAAALRSHHHR